MSGSINKVILIGNLGRPPEVRFSPDGGKIANLSVATSETWKDKASGERRERTEWHRVVIFNDKLAEVSEKYLKKGSKVYLEGQLQTRKWTDQQGQERYTTEVVLSKYRGELTMLDTPGKDLSHIPSEQILPSSSDHSNSGFELPAPFGKELKPRLNLSSFKPGIGLDDEIPF